MPKKTRVLMGQFSILDADLNIPGVEPSQAPVAVAKEEAKKTQAEEQAAIQLEFGEVNAQPIAKDEPQPAPEPELKGPAPKLVNRSGKPVDFAPANTVFPLIDSKMRQLANIRALRLIDRLVNENRYATEQEQRVLAGYTGWRDMASTSKEQEEYVARLRAEYPQEKVDELLSLPQYNHHVEDQVSDTIYKAIKHMGFPGGNILLTGNGAGNLLQRMPQTMRRKSRITIEPTDGVNGMISTFLYPNIEVASQDEGLYESFYDLVIGMVPFDPMQESTTYIGRNEVRMKAYVCTIARALSALRVGGLFGMLVESDHVHDVLCSKTNPFDISPTPLTFVGGLRFDSMAMGDGKIYDFLVFQKCHKKKEIDEKGIFDKETITVKDIDPAGEDRKFPTTWYFWYNDACVLAEDMAHVERDLILQGYADRDKYEQAVNKALRIWNAKKCYAPVTIDKDTESSRSIPADPTVKNFAYVMYKGLLYQRIDSLMVCQKLAGIRLLRVQGMIKIRDLAKDLIQKQLENCTDDELLEAQGKLTEVYDKFVKKYGPVTCQTNTRLFREDADYTILAALEYVDEEEIIHKSDVFSKRTILARNVVTSCATIDLAYTSCIDQKAKVDIAHIAALSGDTEEAVIKSLAGRLIYLNPLYTKKNSEDEWISHDVYLSGNTRQKLMEAKKAAKKHPEFQVNVEALERVVPPLIPAKDIFIKLDAPYIPHDIVRQFLFEVIGGGTRGDDVDTFTIIRQKSGRLKIKVKKEAIAKGDPAFYNEFGTERYSAVNLVEKMINASQIIAYRTETDPVTDKKRRVQDDKHTVVLVEKVEKIQKAFQAWAFTEPKREALLVDLYNQTFNTNTVPKYDGSHLTFPGMTAAIELKQHQKNAVYRIIVENGALVAHVVGAGKTITLLTAGQELRRLGRITKPLYVVPNNLIAQWGGEMMRLYPSCNILLADPADMQKERRERFMGRIATGQYDAIIMGSSSFMLMPPPYHSVARTCREWEEEIYANGYELNSAAQSMKLRMEDERLLFLKRVQNAPYTMEDLGIDYLFIDEAHDFKNLEARTKQGDVKGLSSAAAAKCEDMYYKTKYMGQLHGNKGGFTFATGTPLSNTITEMYSLKRYFIEQMMLERGILSLDDWLSLFGEITIDWELPPEGLTEGGTGYRRVTRVRYFDNLPEMMRLVLQFMDVVTREEIDMDTPDVIRKTETCKASAVQKAMMRKLVNRANDIRNHLVHPSQDNMLLVTVDGRKCALDARLTDPNAKSYSLGKISRCAANIWDYYKKYESVRGTQLVFSDISVPNEKGYSVYQDLKEKLMKKGIPENEIGFAHDFDTVAKKASMRIKMQTGKLRVLIGSTQTVGQGINIQNRLIALHNLDVPYLPMILEQREGRIIRTGNMHSQVYIFSYVTEGSFDSYMYQLVKLKARLIAQIMRGDFNLRRIEDTDTKVLNYAEIEAAATGNTLYLDRAKVEGDLVRLETLKRDFESSQEILKQNVYRNLPQTIDSLSNLIPRMEKDIETLQQNAAPYITIGGVKQLASAGNQKEARKLIEKHMRWKRIGNGDVIGTYRGLSIILCEKSSWTSYSNQYTIVLQGQAAHRIDSTTINGGLSILNLCEEICRSIPGSLAKKKDALKANKQALKAAKSMVNNTFEYEDKLQKLYLERDRLSEEIANCA